MEDIGFMGNLDSGAGLIISWSPPRVGEGRVSMINVPKVFPLKKFDTFCTFTLAPNHQKKVSVEKKLNEPLSPPLDSKSQCAALMLPLGLLCTEACLLNYWAPL